MFHLMAVHGARDRRTSRTRPTARVHRPRPHASPRPQAMTRAGGALGHRGLGARSDRRDPRIGSRSSRTQTATIDMVSGVGRDARRRAGSGRTNTRTGTSPTACSSWPGRTARWCCGSSTPPRPTRSSTRAWPARSSTPTPSLRADAGVLAQEPARAVRPVGLRDLGRPADRAAADRRRGEHRPGAPAGAGARLLAAEGTGGGSGDLERGSRRLSAAAAGPDHGADRRRRRSARDRPARAASSCGAPSRSRTRTGSCSRSVARAIITDSRGTLAEQVDAARPGGAARPAARADPQPSRRSRRAAALPPRDDLILFNGLGGFTPDGREYVITLAPGRGDAGAVGERAGEPALRHGRSRRAASAYTWSENAHEFRLTPWHNDPVSDASGEAFYLRDEETGHFWSPTPLPAAARRPTSRRHGFGYSVFEHTEDGIARSCAVYVALDAPVKFSVLKLRNASGRPRRLSATGYVEWVLGDLRPKSAMHVVTEIDADSGALLRAQRLQHRVRRPGRLLRRGRRRPAPSPATAPSSSAATARSRNPAAMARSRLSGKVGAALDPCAAIQVAVRAGRRTGARDRLPARASDATPTTPAAWCSASAGPAAARARSKRCGSTGSTRSARCRSRRPTPSLNVLANGWLVYQTIACRLWGRSGYYQSGGAFGFRDQLQDVMALVHAEPALVREHLLLLRGPPVPSKATSSTGGIRRRAAACARTARTTTSGCRWRPAAT